MVGLLIFLRLFIGLGDNRTLLFRDVQIGSAERHARKSRIFKAKILDRVEYFDGAATIEVFKTVGDHAAQTALILSLIVVRHALRQGFVENHTTRSGLNQRCRWQDFLHWAAVIDAMTFRQLNADQRMQADDLTVESHQHFIEATEDLAFADLIFFWQGQEVAAQNDVLISRDNRVAVRR